MFETGAGINEAVEDWASPLKPTQIEVGEIISFR